MAVITDKNRTPTFNELLNYLKAQDASLHRYVVPANELQFRKGSLLAREHELDLEDVHFRELCSAVDAPHAYLARLGEPYRSYLLRRHFANGDHLRTLERRRLLGRSRRHTGNVAVTARGGSFLGFARPDLHTLRAADLLDQVETAARKELKDTFDSFIVRSFNSDDTSFELVVSTPSARHEVTVGDVIEGGLHIRHSATGNHATQIEAYIHRLECANGEIKRECVGSSKRGSARIRRRTTNALDPVSQNLQTIFDHTSHVIKGLAAKLQAVSQLRQNRLDGESDVRRFVDTQLREMNRLHSRRLAETVMRAWDCEGRETTQYGVWNAITRTATHASSSVIRPTVRRARFHLGGVLGTRAQHVCPRCYRLTMD